VQLRPLHELSGSRDPRTAPRSMYSASSHVRRGHLLAGSSSELDLRLYRGRPQ